MLSIVNRINDIEEGNGIDYEEIIQGYNDSEAEFLSLQMFHNWAYEETRQKRNVLEKF